MSRSCDTAQADTQREGPRPRHRPEAPSGSRGFARLGLIMRALKPCATDGCANLVPPGRTRCDQCQRQQDATYEQRRDTATQRGYTTKGHRRFRRLVLQRDMLCVLCGNIATEADHYPTDRRTLITQGLDPNDPTRGRGLCKSCHSRETMRLRQGGWGGQGPLPPGVR